MKSTRSFGKLSMLVIFALLLTGRVQAASGPTADKPQVFLPTPSTPPPSPTPTRHYSAIKMASASLGWIVGAAGRTVQYRDDIWHTYPSPTANDLNAVDASPTEAWAVGSNSTIMRNTDNGWQLLANPILTNTNYVDVDLVGPGEVWVVGNPTVLLHYVNGNWSVAATPPGAGQMSWGSPTDGWMATNNRLYHYTNGQWSTGILPRCYSPDCAIEDGQVVSVSMLNVNEGWAGIHSSGIPSGSYGALAQYTSQTGWVYIVGGLQSCAEGADCVTNSATNPDCTVTELYTSAVLALPGGGAYAPITITSDCNNYNRTTNYEFAQIGGGRRTMAHPIVAVSGVSVNELWLFDSTDVIFHAHNWNFATAPVCDTNFADVPPDHFAYAAVTYLSCHGIVSGTGDHIFSPAAPATRIQFAKMITLARGWALTTPTIPTFSDVPATHPLYAYVEAAYANGAINGWAQAQCQARNQAYPCFFPDDNVTRAQTALITKRAFGWADDTTGGPHFSDVPLDFYAYTAIETCYNHNIINGIGGGQFAPNQNVTRAQLALILARTLIRGQ